ncbi:MAG: hypothetical protein KTR31_30245 [Myxococcales bacterium]|nr:hypothetical protein [Myxococcales bacterium]
MLILLAWTSGAEASSDALMDAIVACATEPTFPLPGVSVEDRARLLDGEVVRMIDRKPGNEPSAAVGMAVLRAPREALWVSVQDMHAQVDPSLTEFIVEHLEGDRALWYGYFDLPRPIKDRQWVVDSTNNHRMAARTSDACWEHSWRLVPDGLERIRDTVTSTQPRGITPDHLDRAIYTPVNQGSWFMAPIDGERVFVAYHATSVVGGLIPDWLVTQLAMSRLEELMRSLEKRALTWAPSHYRTGHEPVFGGDGNVVAPFSNTSP